MEIYPKARPDVPDGSQNVEVPGALDRRERKERKEKRGKRKGEGKKKGRRAECGGTMPCRIAAMGVLAIFPSAFAVMLIKKSGN